MTPYDDQPIGELTELEDDTSHEFLRRVINKVDRRQAAAHLVNFGWCLPRSLLGEFAVAVAELPAWLRSTKGKR